MSKISDIVDNFRTELANQFPDHFEHFNPYIIEQNDDHTLDKGYSFFPGPAENTDEFVGCKASIGRTFTVNLTRRYFGTPEDASERIATEKEIFEDQRLLINLFEKMPELNGDDLSLVQFLGDNGIELIVGESISHLAVISRFNIRYFENL